jgi:hypothetical protein
MALDGVHPLVLCRWWEHDVAKGHGITLGTFSQEEADAEATRRRRARLQAVHVRGGHDVKVSRLCPECQAGRGGRAQVAANV